jgi:hypothetical protein
MNISCFFFLNVMITQKTNILILFTSMIDIKWIKTFIVDMDLSHKKKYIIYLFLEVFSVYLKLHECLESNA